MLATDLASLILSTLSADAGLTAQELAAAIGVSARDLRPALRAAVAAAMVVTSGRTRGTRYCLAGGSASAEQSAPPVPTAACRAPRAHRSTAPVATLADDLALADTAARTAAGQTLSAARRRAAIRAQLERGPALLACEAEIAAEQAAAATQVTAPARSAARKPSLRYRAIRPTLPAATSQWHRGHRLTPATDGYLATRGGLVVAHAPSVQQARQAIDAIAS